MDRGKIFAEMSVSTIDLIKKSVSLNPSFKNGDGKTSFFGVRFFFKRQNLSTWIQNRVSQITGTAMQAFK